MEGTTEHLCEQCNKVFTREADLKRHVRVVHDKVKNHECRICSKKFARKQNMELHYKTCYPTKVIGLPTIEKVCRTDLPFKPKLRKSALCGNIADWTIEYPVGTIDPLASLRDGVKAMKATIFKHSYMHTYQLKFYFAAHIVFVKIADPNVSTVSPVVLQTDPVRVFLADLFCLDEIFEEDIKQLMERIETFQKNRNGCVIDHLVRLDTKIISIDPLKAFS